MARMKTSLWSGAAVLLCAALAAGAIVDTLSVPAGGPDWILGGAASVYDLDATVTDDGGQLSQQVTVTAPDPDDVETVEVYALEDLDGNGSGETVTLLCFINRFNQGITDFSLMSVAEGESPIPGAAVALRYVVTDAAGGTATVTWSLD